MKRVFLKQVFAMLLLLAIVCCSAYAAADNQVSDMFHDGRAWFRQGDKYGFINTRGDVVIEPVYQQASNFSNGYASVNVGVIKKVTTYYIIDPDGNVVAKPASPTGKNYYEIVEWFGDCGIMEKWAFKPDKYKNSSAGFQYVNSKGKPLSGTVFTYAAPFDSEGFAVVGTGKLNKKATRSSMGSTHFLAYSSGNGFSQASTTYYYINQKGKQLGKLKFTAPPHAFSEGLAAVPGSSNAKGEFTWGYINPEGKTVIEQRFSSAEDFHDGRAKISVGGKYGYIDPNGEYLIAPRWDAIGDFHEGLAWVKSGELYGYIDQSDQLVCEPQWARAGSFSEGRAAVKEPGEYGKYGYIDSTGTMMINPVYDTAFSFQNGYACVQDGIVWGAVGLDGSMAVPLAYEKITNHGHGVFSAKEYDQPMICNEQGEVITLVLENGALPEHAFPDGTQVLLIVAPEMENGLQTRCFIDAESKQILSMNLFREVPGESFHIETGSGKMIIAVAGRAAVQGVWDEVTAGKAKDKVILKVKQGDLFGFIGEDGKALTNVEYTQAGNYSDDVAIVWKNSKWYILDDNGIVIF